METFVPRSSEGPIEDRGNVAGKCTKMAKRWSSCAARLEAAGARGFLALPP